MFYALSLVPFTLSTAIPFTKAASPPVMPDSSLGMLYMHADGTLRFVTTGGESTLLDAALSGLVKGDGSTFSAAVPGTDYLAPAAIGTTIQGYDATLAALAGKSFSGIGDIVLKSYADSLITGAWRMSGSISAAANPNFPAALKGEAYVIVAAGKIGGASGKSVDVGDVIIALEDNAGGTDAGVGASWIILEHNLAGALLASNNLSELSNPATARINLGLQIGTNVQAYSANLATFASIAPSANVQTVLGCANFAAIRSSLSLVPGTDVQPFSSRLSTYATISPSANVQTLLGAADFAAFRASLGVVIGTNVQAYHSNLAALAGLTGAADKGFYFTGSGAMATFSLPVIARSFLQAGSISIETMAANLGLDTDPTLAANSDSNFPSQKAVRSYVAAAVAGAGAGAGVTPWSVTVSLYRDQSDTTSPATPATFSITDGTIPSDGTTFSINSQYFEFDTDANVTSGNTAIDISTASTAYDLFTAIASAVSTAMSGTATASAGPSSCDITTVATGSGASLYIVGFYSGSASGADGSGTALANSSRLEQIKAAESGKRHFIRSVVITEQSGSAWNNGIAIGYGTNPDSDFSPAISGAAPGPSAFQSSNRGDITSSDAASAALYGYPNATSQLVAVRLGGAGGEAVDGGQAQSLVVTVAGYTV